MSVTIKCNSMKLCWYRNQGGGSTYGERANDREQATGVAPGALKGDGGGESVEMAGALVKDLEPTAVVSKNSRNAVGEKRSLGREGRRRKKSGEEEMGLRIAKEFAYPR